MSHNILWWFGGLHSGFDPSSRDLRLRFYQTYSMRKTLLTVLALGLAAPLWSAQEPFLSDRQIEELRALPMGLSSNLILTVRSRHVDKVHFTGAGHASRYGFFQEGSLIREGLWMRLVNQGTENWASAGLIFEKNTDASRYNCLVMWVRASVSGQRLILTFQDRSWTDRKNPQAVTAAFPRKEFPVGEVVQVVVPFKNLQQKSSLDFSRIQRLGIQYGTGSLGNAQGEIIEIYGFAFAYHAELPKGIVFFNPKRATPPAVNKTKPARPLSSPIVEAKPSPIKTPPVVEPVTVAKPVAPAEPPRPAIVPVPVSTAPAWALVAISSQALLHSEHVAVAASSDIKEITQVKNLPIGGMKGDLPGSWILRFPTSVELTYIGISLTLLIIAALLLIRNRVPKTEKALGPIFHHLSWPLLAEGLANSGRAEKHFWRKLADRKIHQAWLSPYNAFVQRSAGDEHHGESFLLRQAKWAKTSKIRFFPSLCFVRTLFNFESFLARPELYLYKNISPSESHLSDEELRIRHIGFFPVWIPPFWQKKQKLPQKLLVAYGKMPGTMAMSDSVQYNLRSPELRAMAIRVLERFAQKSPGVRIEGAGALLNSSLNLYWGGYFNEMGLAREQEFWSEVIGAVKAKYPNFIFVADGASSMASKLLEVGFDYFENNHLMEILINQIRLEEVGTLDALMSPDAAPLLYRSIFDVSPFFRAGTPGSLPRQQTLLGSMVIGFLPGTIQHDGQIPQELNRFFTLVGHWSPFRQGKFVLLRTTASDVLAFARWEKKVVYIVVANFSGSRRTVSVGFEPFFERLEQRKLYLFNDALHGASLLHNLKTELSQSPAVAVLGQDLKEAGLTISLPELSLRLFSVNLGHPVQHETSRDVHELHKA